MSTSVVRLDPHAVDVVVDAFALYFSWPTAGRSPRPWSGFPNCGTLPRSNAKNGD